MPPVNKKSSPTPASLSEPAQGSVLLRSIDAIYHFLASLKLAVINISTLAAVLSFGTFFESAYGTAAVQQYVYRSPGFAILLAFLGINIFCAASIRFPWKKRQTGFVITHIGLLVVLVGAFAGLKWSDDGQVAIPEGGTSDQLVRLERSVVRVQVLDPTNGEPNAEYALPFFPGSFPWQSSVSGMGALIRGGLAAAIVALVVYMLALRIFRPAWLNRPGSIAVVVSLTACIAILGCFAVVTPQGSRQDRLTDGDQPFKLTIKDYLPSSTPLTTLHESGADGVPMLRLALLAKPPNAPRANDIYRGRGWLVASNPKFARAALDEGPALIVFQNATGENADKILDDFLHPPKDPLKDELARFHYTDNTGKPRVFELKLNDMIEGKSTPLPESDLVATLDQKGAVGGHDDPGMAGMARATGERVVHLVKFKVRKANGPELDHYAVASLPMIPSFLATAAPGKEALVQIGYFHPPTISQGGAAMSGRFGVIEVLAAPGGKLYYRAFGRDGLRGIGPIKPGEEQKVFGGDKMPMQIAFRVDDYLPSGVTREICEPMELPKEDRDKATPACVAELTFGGITREFWLRRNYTLDNAFLPHRPEPTSQVIEFPSGKLRVAYDFDRKVLPFELKLTDFEPGKDPGSQSPATYRSDVLLTDSSQGIEQTPKVITMNEPLTHRGWTFYQSSFDKDLDPETGDPEGLYRSMFAVRYDPAWKIIYSGCLLVVIGIFTQFYMRAGVFSDGGKKERERAEAREQAKARTPVGAKAVEQPQAI